MEENSAANNDIVVEVEVIPEGSLPKKSREESRDVGEEAEIEERSPEEETIESLREPILSPDEVIEAKIEYLREPTPSHDLPSDSPSHLPQEAEANSPATGLGSQYQLLAQAIAEVNRNAVLTQLQINEAQQKAIAQNLERMTAAGTYKKGRGNPNLVARQRKILNNMYSLMQVFEEW
ncbi:MAG: hypothetical protein F6J93_17960 [Oscillatoria sp. SIO1A7]|nr:hypothetical protein [Oscillatoria sp. SIO1A7]